jgi:hypothetical protein
MLTPQAHRAWMLRLGFPAVNTHPTFPLLKISP